MQPGIGARPGGSATENSDYNEISYIWATTSWASDDWRGNFQGSYVRKSAYYNHIHHCKFEKHGYLTELAGGNEGNVFDVGVAFADESSDATSYNVIEDNEFFHGGHATLGISGAKNIIRNNYLHNENWYLYEGNYYGYRNIISMGKTGYVGHNLIENNRIGYASENINPNNYGGGGIKLGSPYNIFRYNSFFGNKSAATYIQPYVGYAPANYNHIYNNTYYANGFATMEDPPLRSRCISFGYNGINVLWDVINSNVVKNNLFYSNYNSVAGVSAVGPGDYADGNNVVTGNWDDYETQDDPLFVNEDTSDKTSWILPDLNLQSNSPCINQGVHLTQTNGSGSNSVTLIVDDARYFQDGNFGHGGLSWPASVDVQADYIAIGTVGNTVQINSINYSTNTITLASAMTWSDNANIWLYRNSSGTQVLYGSAPDMGAHEFGGETLSPPVRSGGSPTGTLPSGTTSTTLSLSTNENATCRYSTTAGVSYSSMTNTFSTTGGTSHSTTVSGLSDGDSYSYCVRCQDDSGNVNTSDYGISFSVAVPDFEPPTIPSCFLSSSVSSSQINLTWTASTDNLGVAGYTIYRDELEVDTSPTNSYSDTGLSPSTTYTYTVSAYDAEGNESSQSSSASATTLEASAFIEAQSGTITSPMQIVSDAEASGGAYIQTIQADSGTAAYTFNIDESGTYKIIARVYASDGGSDSFYVKIDDGEEFVWHLNPSGNPDEFNVWREDEVNNQGTGTWDNPQYDPYTIELTQGTHTITFRGREPNCRLDYFYFSKVVSYKSYKWVQAESENITSPLETVSDPDASAGAYIWKPSRSGDTTAPDGVAEYTIDIPTTGDYVIWGRVIAPDGGCNSFFTSIDGGEHVAWHIPIGSVWIWVSVNGNEQDPLILNLAAGIHTLRISGREDGTKLDRLLITNDMAFVPSEENPDNVPPHAVRNLRIEE